MTPANRNPTLQMIGPRHLVGKWMFGLIMGTLLIAITSPLFVRSYPARVWDEVRQRFVYPKSLQYRWRSEGYASSAVGPHGMMGQTQFDDSRNAITIALWGDSQAEGVGVKDEDKLFVAIERRVPKCSLLPFAVSGDDAMNWVKQFPLVEDALGVEEHFILVCELEDLEVLAGEEVFADEFNSDTHSNVTSQSLDHLKGWLPDFVIDSGRSLLLDEFDSIRQLRFTIGPESNRCVFADLTGTLTLPQEIAAKTIPWSSIATRLADQTQLPITVIYAPKFPVVMGNQVAWMDDRTDDFQSLASALGQHKITVVDCRDALRQSATDGVFPHGFHNGLIGSGHLNADGYRVIAGEIAASRREPPRQRVPRREPTNERVLEP